jgi:hypothetical protein
MCNLYSITTNQAAILNLFRVINREARHKRSHLVALRTTKISATDPPSHWWPGER